MLDKSTTGWKFWNLRFVHLELQSMAMIPSKMLRSHTRAQERTSCLLPHTALETKSSAGTLSDFSLENMQKIPVPRVGRQFGYSWHQSFDKFHRLWLKPSFYGGPPTSELPFHPQPIPPHLGPTWERPSPGGKAYSQPNGKFPVNYSKLKIWNLNMGKKNLLK